MWKASEPTGCVSFLPRCCEKIPERTYGRRFDSGLILQCTLAERTVVRTSHINMGQEAESWYSALSLLFPFYSAQAPSPQSGAVHI